METTPYTFEEMDEFLVSRYLKERGVPEEYAEKLEGKSPISFFSVGFAAHLE